MAKIYYSIFYTCYGIFLLFLGELLVMRYTKSAFQLVIERSYSLSKPDGYVLFNSIFIVLIHIFSILVNFFMWYSIIKLLF